MAPLVALVALTLLTRLAGFAGVEALDSWQVAVRAGLAAMFLLTGFAHFSGKLRGDMIKMVPPQVPAPAFMVTLTGVLEIAGAAGVLVPRTASLAAICLGLLLLVMFPANVYAARQKLVFGGRPSTPLVPRTLLQIVFVAACIYAAW
ncbi:DoxX family protein [Longispora albida]|uniref:DoxX family protein n=1 Tax=Longispora albida TaxID=203523 RepID=UPI00037D6C64|nr:DoxX family membrane protein [Longispora albida]